MDIQTDLGSLNDKQREAVLTEDKRVLVLAGAGSGKTKTLLQKLICLIHDKKVRPGNILAVTFTRNAANEMIDRLIISADESGEYERVIQNKFIPFADKATYRVQFTKRFKWIENLTIRTFHSLCYKILRDSGVSEFDNQFKVITDKKMTGEQFDNITAPETNSEVMDKIIREASENMDFCLLFKRFILDYFVDRIDLDHKRGVAHAFDGKFYTTLQGERVRSKSERDIADWLWRHRIKYIYEPEVNLDFSFRPDFFIPQANLYLEHNSDKSYKMHNKEVQMEKAGKTYLRIFEDSTIDSGLFSKTMDRIVKGRLSDNYTVEAAISFEEEFRFLMDHVREFRSQVLRVLDMAKVEDLLLEEIYKKSQKDPHERIRLFYQLAYPLLRKYNAYCINKSYLDFNDMILRTLSLFANQPELQQKYQQMYQYILVDEFQDVNSLQVKLIKQLLTDDTQLFCVGDDWQSIYGFRGSEVDYIVHFTKYFTDARVIKLRMNYRSTDSIVGASNEVIRHNKFMVEKEIIAAKRSKSKINIYAAKDKDAALDYCMDEIHRLLKDGFTHEDILFLYRRTKMFAPYKERIQQDGLKVKGITIHASKGLEARAVFIIGLTYGIGGFPDVWLDDRIFQVVKKSRHDMLLEEERRLFYVALTRARDELFLITEIGNESTFINEIPEQYSVSNKDYAKPLMDKILLCDNCSAQIEEHFKFCPHCGAKVMAD